MKVSHRIDKSVCGAVLSSRAVASPPSAPLPNSLGRHGSRPLARCIHDQQRKLQTSARPETSWISASAAADPATGTLLPFLYPAAWSSPWKRPVIPRPASRTIRRPHNSGAPEKTNSAVFYLHGRLSVRTNHTSSAAAAAASPNGTANPSPPLPAIPRPPPSSTAAVVPGSFWTQRRPGLSKSELLAFVDPPADGDSVDEHLDFIRDPYLRRYAPRADGPEVAVSHAREDAEFPTWKDVEQADESVQATVHELARAVWARLRNPVRASAASVYDIYRRLPGTRMSYLPASLRHQLLKALGMVEKKDAASMLRYFAVVADAKDSGFSLWKAEWNAAISFASRYVGASTAAETEAAVGLWREMEQEAGLAGNEVTFNILFDVASKAGNFTLAEMVYQEMEKRGLRFNRYHHVSLIHFFGLKMDADGVRAAYQEMVQAGEMIDVVVLNCVLAGFLRCGEEDAAERVYARMRQSYVDRLRAAAASKKAAAAAKKAASHADGELTTQANIAPASPATATTQPQPDMSAADTSSSSSSPPSLDSSLQLPLVEQNGEGALADLLENGEGAEDPAAAAAANLASQKAMTRVLMMLAKVSRGDAALRRLYYSSHLVPTRPDLATYRILVNHHAVRLGDLAAVTRYLADMKTFRIPLHGAIFLALFKGFALHGGRPGTGAHDWSEQRLRGIWAALLKALDDEHSANGLYVSTWLIVWVLRAFDRCSSNPEMVFKAYNSLCARWPDPSEADADFAVGFLHNLLKDKRRRPGHQGPPGQSKERSARPSMLGQLGSRRFG